MKITKVVHKTENLTPSREMWEIQYDSGWDCRRRRKRL